MMTRCGYDRSAKIREIFDLLDKGRCSADQGLAHTRGGRARYSAFDLSVPVKVTRHGALTSTHQAGTGSYPGLFL